MDTTFVSALTAKPEVERRTQSSVTITILELLPEPLRRYFPLQQKSPIAMKHPCRFTFWSFTMISLLIFSIQTELIVINLRFGRIVAELFGLQVRANKKKKYIKSLHTITIVVALEIRHGESTHTHTRIISSVCRRNYYFNAISCERKI